MQQRVNGRFVAWCPAASKLAADDLIQLADGSYTKVISVKRITETKSEVIAGFGGLKYLAKVETLGNGGWGFFRPVT